MRRQWMPITTALLILMGPVSAYAQQPGSPARPAVLDAAAIRKQAAQMGEVRALLSDTDPNVRLLAIREIARSGDPIQRQMAIEAGLSSAEASMQEVALRALISDTQQIFISLTKADGTPITDGQASLGLNVEKFDAETGKIQGFRWSGQIQGAVFSFSNDANSGRLIWEPESGEFRGTVNVANHTVTGDRKGVWRPH